MISVIKTVVKTTLQNFILLCVYKLQEALI